MSLSLLSIRRAKPQMPSSVPPRKRGGASGPIYGMIAAVLFITPAFAANAPNSFAPLVKEVAPAVVNVSTTQKVQGGPMMDFPFQDLPEDSPFREFFKRFFNGPMGPGGQGGKGGGRMVEQHSLGSGFIIDPSGYVVTNNHVVGKATDIDVTLTSGKSYKAKLIGRDQRTDLALLKINADEKLPAVTWGDSDKSDVGDWVIAVGNPFGLGGTVTAGIISARGRDLHEGPYDNFIQTDAAINRGNSGGPMFNMDGQVIGINSAIYSPNGGSVGIGFAIPSSIAKPVVAQLKDHGSVERGWLGVQIQQITPEMAESLGLKLPEGALVASLTKDSPAKAAGIQQGDVITRFNGVSIKDLRDLTRAVADVRPGTSAPVTVWREGREQQIDVRIGKAPETNIAEDEEAPASSAPTAEDTKVPSLGLTLGNLTSDARKELGLGNDVKGALVTDVDDNVPAAEQGIKPGDVITKIGQDKVSSPKDAAARVAKAKQAKQKSVLVLVNRRGNELYVAIPFVPS